MDYEQKMNSKPRRFFDQLYGLVVINFVTIMVSILIVTIVPAITTNISCIIDIRQNGSRGVLKNYFKTLWTKMDKTFLIGLFFTIIMVVAAFSIYFYRTRFDPSNVIGQIGYWVMMLVMVFVLLFSLHIPFIVVKFPSLKLMDTIRLSIYICFRRFVSTLIILVFDILIVVGVLALPLWIFFGISLPLYLSEKLTQPTYIYFKQINIEEIMMKARLMEDEEDEDDSRD